MSELVSVTEGDNVHEFFILDSSVPYLLDILRAMRDQDDQQLRINLLKMELLATEESRKTIWEVTFGSAAETWTWWRGMRFVEGDWDTPGIVEATIDDPEGDGGVTALITVEDVAKAIAKINVMKTAHDPCTGEFDMTFENWDACVADAVLQTAVLGEVVYG